MNTLYEIEDTSEIITPALVLFREVLEDNLDKMIAIAGDVSRLRPHCKTHKMREIIEMQLTRGITKHKCATFPEAEMLAAAGVRDVLLAYHLVGPNIGRAVRFVELYPDVTLSVITDHAGPTAALGTAMADAGLSVEVLLDVDTGQRRTGIGVGEHARQLYGQIVETEGLKPGGLHIYDGHQHHKSRAERAAAINVEWEKVVAFRDDLLARGWPVPRIVAGGTASFPVYSEKDDPTIEVSPGTCLLQDTGYAEHFPDLQFTPAALLLTRVVSRPAADRLTLDLGYKAVASDPPAGKRLFFPDLPDARQILQYEEHLVLQTDRAEEFQPGDELLAVPTHVCPTSALHKQVFVVSAGQLTDRWDVAARDRRLTV